MAGQHAAWSQCVREGVVTMSSLELDHEPPLTAEERLQPHVVLDPMRVGFACRSCHARKTRKQQAKGDPPPPPPNGKTKKGMA
jgi:hypothetical protein